MGLLLDAAKTWDSLSQTVYSIEAGRKGKQFSIELSFDPADFPHLAGMHYAKDISFGLRPAQYYGTQLIPALLSGALDDALIMKSRSWSKIEGRLKAIVNLKSTLEGDFVIARFAPGKVPGFCNIQAEYVIKNTGSSEVFFVFLDQKSGRYYCKSAFQSDNLDYTVNQSLLTILEVTKHVSGMETVLRRHPSYKPDMKR